MILPAKASRKKVGSSGIKRAVVLSLALHFGLLGALLLENWRLPSEPKTVTQPTFIIVEQGPSSKRGSKAAKSSDPAQKKRARKTSPDFGANLKSLKDLAKQGSSQEAGPESSSNSGSGPGGGRGHGDGYDTANRMGIDQEGKLYPFFSALWRKVDGMVNYPNDFVQQRIKGKVTVQLVVDRRGVFTGEVRSIRGDEPMLNTFVVAALIHALHSPLPESAWMREDGPGASDRMLIVFQFEFDLFGPGGSPRKTEFAHLKNILDFRRDAYVDPKLNQMIEKFFTRYMPPIIPIPGGFYIDFIRAYQLIRNEASHTPDEDVQRVRRIEINKEKWESVIKRETGEQTD